MLDVRDRNLADLSVKRGTAAEGACTVAENHVWPKEAAWGMPRLALEFIPDLFESRMPHVFAFDEIDNVFGNIAASVAYSLQ